LETDYAEIQKQIKDIVEICEGIPETYREKCFEYLIENVLLKKSVNEEPQINAEKKTEEKIKSYFETFTLNFYTRTMDGLAIN